MGGVERTHRSRWGFERTFYMWLVQPVVGEDGKLIEQTGYEKGEMNWPHIFPLILLV